MSKQRNDNIGHVRCIVSTAAGRCHEVAAVRRNRSGKLYCDCPEHGRLTPNLPGGQGVLMDEAVIWGAGGPPGDCPRWIAEQWSWGAVMRDPAGRVPVNGADPVNRAAPVNEVPTVKRTAPPPPPEPEPAPAPVNEPAPAPADADVGEYLLDDL